MEKKPVTTIVGGIIIAAILIIYTLVLYFTGNEGNKALSWIGTLLFMGAIIYFVWAYGKAMDNNLTFGKLFSYGFKMAATVTVLMIVFTVIFNLAFPEFKEKAFEMARQQMEQDGKLSDDQVNTALAMTRKFFIVGLMMGLLFVYGILGAIAALIGAAITKKNPVLPFDNQIS